MCFILRIVTEKLMVKFALKKQIKATYTSLFNLIFIFIFSGNGCVENAHHVTLTTTLDLLLNLIKIRDLCHF